jgi:hypothetical protein
LLTALMPFSRVVDEDPPRLPEDRFSTPARDFVAKCLTKRVEDRSPLP